MGSHFIGPNAGDTFERKRDKLFGRQLPLSESVFPEVTRRFAFVKGRIFYHPKQPLPEVLPDGMASDHLRGIWLRISELEMLEGIAGRFCLLEKPHWLAPEVLAILETNLLEFGELKARLDIQFSGDERPVLLCGLALEAECWRETARIFVVGDDWPRLADN